MKNNFSSLISPLFFCILEGSFIMFLQIIAGCMRAPWFGNTLQSWAVIIGITFLAYAIGYLAAGRFTLKQKYFFNFFLPLYVSGIYILIIARFLPGLFISFLDHTPPFGALFGGLIFLLVPVSFLSVIPVVASRKLANIYSPGKSNGLAFFYTTLGGITSACLTGFYIVPEFGTKTPIVAGAFLLVIISLIILFKSNYKKAFLPFAGIIIVIYFLFPGKREFLDNKNTIYRSEGILGELTISDDSLNNNRSMYLNNLTQSVIDITTKETRYGYVNDIIRNTGSINENSSVLILGLGGGYLAKYFLSMGCRTDIVELDKRIVKASEKFFGLNTAKAGVYVDDARHYINTASPGKYDIVIIDIYTGDNAPFHVITLESFKQINRLLKAEGVLCVFFPYSVEKNIKSAYCKMLNTLNAAGFKTTGNRNQNNLKAMIYCSKKASNKSTSEQPVYECDNTGGDIFHDNFPELEILLSHQGIVVNNLRKNLWKKTN